MLPPYGTPSRSTRLFFAFHSLKQHHICLCHETVRRCSAVDGQIGLAGSTLLQRDAVSTDAILCTFNRLPVTPSTPALANLCCTRRSTTSPLLDGSSRKPENVVVGTRTRGVSTCQGPKVAHVRLRLLQEPSRKQHANSLRDRRLERKSPEQCPPHQRNSSNCKKRAR